MATKSEIVKFWRGRANEDKINANALLSAKRYSAWLFFVHLSIEKILKALIIEKTGEAAPFSHDLLSLANAVKIELSDDQKDILREINTFNIAARYDDYKMEFYKKANKGYTKKYFDLSGKLYLWLEKKFTQQKK